MNRKISKELNFRRAYTQIWDRNFCMKENCCFICQKSFSYPFDYDDHIEYHKGDESIPLARQLRDFIPSFNISYKHFAVTNTLTFTITTDKDVFIDAIVIIRQEGHKLMHLIKKSKIRCSNKRTYTTSVDCSFFNIAEEQPFFIIYRSIGSLTRDLEQYIFFRKNNFRVSQDIKLELIHKLPQHFPTYAIRKLGKGNYNAKDVIAFSTTMRQFLVEKRLNKSNYVDVLSFLLNIEDHSIMANYEKIDLKELTIAHLGSDNYSFELSQINKVRQFLGSYDEIVISSLRYTDDYYDEDVFKFNYSLGERTKYFGSIDDIKGKTVYFSLRGKIAIPVKEKFNIKIYPCRIPFRYQYEAFDRISNSPHILNILFPTANRNNYLSTCSLEFFNESVKNNPEQAQAVRNIVNGSNNSMPFILFGPPGTGKSTTILESVLQLWKMKPSSKILVTSGSNAACDEVAKRLCKIFEEIDCEGFNLLRIYATSSGKKMDNTEEILVEASNYAYGHHFYPGLESIYQYRVVVATLTICGKLVQANISDSYFSHIIIDECAASTESEALVGIAGLMGPNTKLILSGDPKQLGPVLKCRPAQNFGFDISMMERLLNLQCYAVDPDTNNYDKSIQAILVRNFRSNAGILSIANKLCYNSQLLAHAKPELTDWVVGWKKLPTKHCPIIFHNVYGQTERENGGTSSMNSEEIEVVMEYTRDILENGINGRKVEQNEIGIISPYKKQYSEIRKELNKNGWSKVETGSAETFQGQEKPIIIISTVKSFTKYIGFLDNLKRLNVMLTRAQALMIIVGNPKSLQNDANWLQVLKYFQKMKAFKGKFRLPKETTSSNENLSPDVSKTRNNSNSNRGQFKSKNPHQACNVFTKPEKTRSHYNRKEFLSVANGSSSQTESMIQKKDEEKPSKPLGMNKSVPTTSSQYNSGRSHHRSTSASTSKASTSSALGAVPRSLGIKEPLPLVSSEVNYSPSEPRYEQVLQEYRDENLPLYRDLPSSYYESVSLQLDELRLRNSASNTPNHKIWDVKPKNKKPCIIL